MTGKLKPKLGRWPGHKLLPSTQDALREYQRGILDVIEFLVKLVADSSARK